MIRSLQPSDQEQTIKFLQQSSSMNLFTIGDIYQYGMQTDFQQLWGDFDSEGTLRGILLRYQDSFIPTAYGDFDMEGFAEIILQHTDQLTMLSGSQTVIDAFRSYTPLPLNWEMKRDCYFAEMTQLHEKTNFDFDDDRFSLRKIKSTEVPKLVALLDKIKEFPPRSNDLKFIQNTIETGASRCYVIEANQKFISSAQTTAENPHSAMVVAVATDPAYRGKGLASQVVSKLCGELLAEGKQPCLFFDNPAAGSIYHRLGFRDIGKWTMVQKKQNEAI
ncbi:GNAT family N-acetyltransferase [Risungbinella massiliensis]|uniref:GNAT family N-acetyltransferase n=1 Tax=Risungbinella massiliensis TaxID=1329796 RepID=UPI0005CBC371|nr:GNAT family N-acetyltransferase [Risungbinella massiliensis]